MSIWEFTEFKTKDLEKAIILYDKLKDMGLCFVDEDAIREMEAELDRRYEKK